MNESQAGLRAENPPREGIGDIATKAAPRAAAQRRGAARIREIDGAGIYKPADARP
ncbi:hypothetical protein [Frateuria defendens]|uniref:hypothetical protein n=1 Tax=Frateuria defendens TaxID=2219559 RepID=UPI0013791C4E|nr:hypothetical protein [Frateuria defendens]